MEELINVLKNNPDGTYDYICNNYYNMSKEELKDFAKELLYAIHSNINKAEHDKILNAVSVELAESYEE